LWYSGKRERIEIMMSRLTSIRNDLIFKKEYSSLSEREREIYDDYQKLNRDRMDNDKAVRKESLAECEYNNALEIARKMKKRGIPTEEIMEFTGLSKQEIENLK
jgi:hypothetical protein